MTIAVSKVVPYKHVEVPLLEESQVVSVRVVYHMLVEHGVRVAQNKGMAVFVQF